MAVPTLLRSARVTRYRALCQGWGLALVMMTGFSALGTWQVGRMRLKQIMLDEAATVLKQRAAIPLKQALYAGRSYDWVHGSGTFTDAPALLLDNQTREGRAGVRVYRVFALDQDADAPSDEITPVLVDLGWLPLEGRRTMPDIPRPDGPQWLEGLLAPPPSTGLANAPAVLQANGTVLTVSLSLHSPDIAQQLHQPRLAERVLRLAPELPIRHTVVRTGPDGLGNRADTDLSSPNTTPMNAPISTPERNHNRWLLVLIFVIFLGCAGVAVLLRLSGWQPQGMGNHGELINPLVDLRQTIPELADGSGAYPWAPAEKKIWRMMLALPADCGTSCEILSAELDKIWQLMGPQADRVHILWMGKIPTGAVRNVAWRVLNESPALRTQLPDVNDPAGIPVYIIDPYGFVMMRHAPGFDPAHLREDLAKLLKLR